MQQSGARSPREDEDRAHETSGLVQGGHGTRAEEWRDPEPSAEDQPVEGATLGAEDRRGTPDGMTPDDVQARSDIARFLGTSAFPGTRDELLAKARENQATSAVLGRIGSAPEGPFENMQELARAIGIGTEEHRQ
jgi:hypothetical protein